MLWAAILYLPVLAVFLAAVRTSGHPISADVLFVGFNAIGLLGTAISVNENSEVERRYLWLVVGMTSICTLIISLLRFTWPRSLHFASSARPTPLTPALVVLYLISAAVSLGYFAAIGRITLVEALTSAGPYDSATARLESYAGSSYFFPGYVNQFKNAVLPVTTAAIVHQLFTRRAVGRWPLSAAMVAFAFVMVAGTGQRGAMVLSVLVLLAGLVLARALTTKALVTTLASFFALFSLQTVVLQRQASDLAGADGVGARVGVFLQAFWSRVVLENPRSGIAAYHYTETLPTSWGDEWVADLLGILPGQRGSDLANRVFFTLYGSYRGTAPPSLWGDIYYNFDLAGSVAVASAIAIGLACIARFTLRALARDQSPTLLRVLCAAGMAVSSGAWIAGSPATLLNQGFLAYAVLFTLAPRICREGRSSATDRRWSRTSVRRRPAMAEPF